MKTVILANMQTILSVAVLIAFAGVGYLFVELRSLTDATHTLASTTQASFNELEQKNVALSDQLYSAEQVLTAIQSRLGGFEDTLGTLEKLSKTDPELLQKYSKVFFLNEHYAPERLSEIEKEYLYDEDRTERIHSSVLPHLEDLLNEAEEDNIELYVKSAFRSFNEQTSIKTSYSVTYGAGTANTFSADQGYSEHQLGTTVDFISTGQNGELRGFEKTEAYQWLLANAHKYGFTLSYPENNGYYIFEPWHWRFVGTDLASSLHRREKNFYDLEQREIDEYLAEIFD